MERRLTVEGRLLRDKGDSAGVEKRRDVKRAFGLPTRCLRLRLVGKADAVKFHRQRDGSWRTYPEEHKRGRRKQEDWDRAQLCAQALCLEEMLDVARAWIETTGAVVYRNANGSPPAWGGVCCQLRTDRYC